MTPALRDSIKQEVLIQQNLKLSDQDPLFAYLIANNKILEGFAQPILDAMELLPAALAQSLEILAEGVEQCEKASQDIAVRTQGALQAIAKMEQTAAHQTLRSNLESSITAMVGDALASVSKELSDVERRVKAVNGGWGSARARFINTCLAVSLVVVVGVSSVVGFALYQSGKEHSAAAAHWYELAKKKGGRA